MGSTYSAPKPPPSAAPIPQSGRPRRASILTGGLAGSLAQATPAKTNPVVEGMIDNILRREGKFNPGDPSMRGIKLKTLRTFRNRAGNPLPTDRQNAIAELRKLTEGQARDIYRKLSSENQIGRILDKGLAEQVFDGAMNSGGPRGIRQLQRAINRVSGSAIAEDGTLGSKTGSAIVKLIHDGKLKRLRNELVRERVDFLNSSQDPNIVKYRSILIKRARSFGVQ